MVSLLDFINSISYTDNIQDVNARTVGGSVDLLALGGRLTPLALGGRLTPLALGGRLTPLALGGRLTPLALGGRLTPHWGVVLPPWPAHIHTTVNISLHS